MKTLKFYSLFFIITLFSCTEENNYYTTAEGLGKVNVYIEGDLTDAECAAKLKAEVGTITENIFIGGVRKLTNLTTLELDVPLNVRKISFGGIGTTEAYPILKNIKITGHGAMPDCILKVFTGPVTETVLIEGFTELLDVNLTVYSEQTLPTSIVCNDLVYVHRNFAAGGGGTQTTNFVPIPNTLICNDLKFIDPNNIYGEYANFVGIFEVFSFNSLKKIGPVLRLAFAMGGGSINDISFPALEEVGDIEINTMRSIWPNGLNSLNFPSLTKTTSAGVYDRFLGTLNLPVLNRCDYIDLKDMVLPSTIINMPNLNYCIYYVSDIKLSTNGVNTILNKFLNIQPQSNKFIELSNEVAPTGQGLIDKQTLINQGNLVYTN